MPEGEKLPPDVERSVAVVYRSTGLGIFGAIARFAGMPLEKIALFMNSSQVSGSGSSQLAQAARLTFAEGYLGPYRLVGRASMVAWFLQYSVMGFVFQMCDSLLSQAFGVRRMLYGEELMQSPEERRRATARDGGATDTAKTAAKAILAPMMAGSVESVVSNRAEVQRYYGIQRFAKIEAKLAWNPISRLCGPAFLANSSRNFIMSSTSFILTPYTFANLCPQEKKSQQSLFWWALGVNIFVGNSIAITQQALWGRALDYGAVDGGRSIQYREVVRQGLASEGFGAFYTPAKWFARVLMNAPAQGTLPFVYNQVLPLGEVGVMRAAANLYHGLFGR